MINRRKSIRTQRVSTSTLSSMNGRESSSINGYRRPPRSPRNDLHEIKEYSIEEDPMIEVKGSHLTLEVNGNHICPKDKIERNAQEEDSSVTSLVIVENPTE